MRFNDKHDPNVPLQWWFQESHEGTILFIVFYTMACRYGRCVGCNLYQQQSSSSIHYICLINQINNIFGQQKILERKDEITKVIISNNGSVLDEKTFSSTALVYFIALMGKNLPRAKTLSLETRPEYVDNVELEFFARVRRDTILDNFEIAVGIEAYNDYVRNVQFSKSLSLVAFEKFVEKVSLYGFWIKCYFMFKPVAGMTNEESIHDIRQAITYLDELATEFQVKINMHLNPTYVAKGTKLEQEFHEGKYVPPRLRDVAKAVLSGKGTAISIYVGLYDEGLAVEGGSFIRPGDEDLITALDMFNRTQSFQILHDVLSPPPTLIFS